MPDAGQVGADFAPYQTEGSWGTTDGGDWMWQSNYSWGYIPFHYGRWVWAGNNWGWIPGRRYAPAWVTWRVGEGGYLGWAPLPPTWYWGGRGRPVALPRRAYAAYCFVPTNYAFLPNVSRYVVRDWGMVGAIAGTTRPYHPATPSVGSHGSVAVHRGYPASPRLSEAHIPASASPRFNASPDPRATALATRGGGRASYARSVAGYYSHGGYAGGRAQAGTLRTPPSRGYEPVYRSLGRSSYPMEQRYAQPRSAVRPRTTAAPRPRSAPQVATPHASSSHSSGGRRR